MGSRWNTILSFKQKSSFPLLPYIYYPVDNQMSTSYNQRLQHVSTFLVHRCWTVIQRRWMVVQRCWTHVPHWWIMYSSVGSVIYLFIFRGLLLLVNCCFVRWITHRRSVELRPVLSTLFPSSGKTWLSNCINFLKVFKWYSFISIFEEHVLPEAGFQKSMTR